MTWATSWSWKTATLRGDAARAGCGRPRSSCCRSSRCLAGARVAAQISARTRTPAPTNPCRFCHDTAAGTPSLRGWAGAGAGPATGWGAKPISALCYTCHNSGGGPLANPGHNMLSNAYADASHGFVVADAPGSRRGRRRAPGSTRRSPRAVSRTQHRPGFECTTCHNVHLRHRPPVQPPGDRSRRCATSATAAAPPTARSARDSPARRGPTAPTRRGRPLADTARANIKATPTSSARLKVAIPPAPGWSLGGHLCDLGRTTHGLPDLPRRPRAGAGHGRPHGPAGDRQHDRAGNADPLAALRGVPLRRRGRGAGRAALSSSPGCRPGQWSDHPIDAAGNRTFYPTGAALPALWLGCRRRRTGDRGAQPFYTGAAHAPVCSSCHDTHGGIATRRCCAARSRAGLGADDATTTGASPATRPHRCSRRRTTR